MPTPSSANANVQASNALQFDVSGVKESLHLPPASYPFMLRTSLNAPLNPQEHKGCHFPPRPMPARLKGGDPAATRQRLIATRVQKQLAHGGVL
jgi:hypothetical protein